MKKSLYYFLLFFIILSNFSVNAFRLADISDLCLRAKCKDNSISFDQPRSSGPFGMYGRCGHVAISNIFSNVCNQLISPINLVSSIKDITPGINPRTLRIGLNRLFSNNSEKCLFDSKIERWISTRARNESNFLDIMSDQLELSSKFLRKRDSGEILSRHPMVAFIKIPNSFELHYVTIIDIERDDQQCNIFYNHWGIQEVTSCENFSGWSRGVRRVYPFLFRSYMLIKREVIN